MLGRRRQSQSALRHAILCSPPSVGSAGRFAVPVAATRPLILSSIKTNSLTEMQGLMQAQCGPSSIKAQVAASTFAPFVPARISPVKALQRSRAARKHQSSAARLVRAQAVATQEAAPKSPPAKNSSEFQLKTLTLWLLKEEQEGRIDNELAVVLSSIAVACKQIASMVNRAGISNLTGLAGEQNISGEDQKKLDIVSNEVFSNCLRASGRTGVIASEEEDEPVAVEETYSGNYVVVFDPLDGSSNIDAGISTGSIFGVYAPSEECRVDDMDDPLKMMENCLLNTCQPGSALLTAGYCLYSSSTIFVVTTGNGVYGFTLDPLVGEFIMSHEDVKVPESGKIYAFNEGNYMGWEKGLQDYMMSLKDPEKHGGKPYSARYIGSLVGDFHRTMLYGGIYGYPADKTNKTGKLRLLYECAPMSYIMEQAGGTGSTGQERVLDICPEKVHQRVPLFVGSPKEVEYLESFIKK